MNYCVKKYSLNYLRISKYSKIGTPVFNNSSSSSNNNNNNNNNKGKMVPVHTIKT
jgi:hypothetical protein